LRTARPANGSNAYHYTPDQGFDWFAPSWGPVRGNLDVSADGRVVANNEIRSDLRCTATAQSSPFPDSKCQLVTTSTARVIAPNRRIDPFSGYAQVSRNGRYAVLSTGPTMTCC